MNLYHQIKSIKPEDKNFEEKRKDRPNKKMAPIEVLGTEEEKQGIKLIGWFRKGVHAYGCQKGKNKKRISDICKEEDAKIQSDKRLHNGLFYWRFNMYHWSVYQ